MAPALGRRSSCFGARSPTSTWRRLRHPVRRRKNKDQLGFYINPITGQWSRKDEPGAADEPDNDGALLDKVPNQQIVPFVEDHRNILILAPAKPLELEAMATLQAALKRGIEMTFQIEESELVAEPLPKQDDRKALLFYEAAEGGAGVLTRLATEPGAMAQVAAAALRLMHHDSPAGPWTVEGLPALEQKLADGQSICEAGCYQCLLSYFNQPDHENINRRDEQALKMLVAMANAQVGPAQAEAGEAPATQPPTPATPARPGVLDRWLHALEAAHCKAPDATQLSVLGGRATVAAQYKANRTLVVLEALPPELRAELLDKGWAVIDMSAPEQWEALFQQHAHVFH